MTKPLEATPQMQYIAAICFRDGIGTQENPEKSAALLKESAEQNYDLACDLYGQYLLDGYGVEQNAKAGFDIIDRAANRGSIISMNSLAVLCQKGEIYPDTSLDEAGCLLYTSPSPRDKRQSRMPSSA